MTTRLNSSAFNWQIYASNIQSNPGQNLTLDISGSNVATFGSNTIDGSTYNQSLNVNGPYFSGGVSATQIAADSSNNRPSGQIGYIRYNTDTNLIEYWNGDTNSWDPISPPTPIFGSISPQYILQDVSSTLYTVNGSNFNSSSNVSFIGNNDLVVYPSAVTSFISSLQLTCLITDEIADASNNSFFAVRVVNTNTGFSATSGNIVVYNTGPFWNTVAGSSLGTGVSDVTYTTGNSPFTDLSASDVPPENLPISYFSSTTPLNGSAPLVSLNSSLGRLFGTMPTVSTSTLYNFSAYPQDASGALGPVVSFNFSVAPFVTASAGLSPYMTVSYVDSSNNIVGSPVVGGAVIYTFKDTSATAPGTTRTGTITVNLSRTATYLVVAGGGGGGGEINFSGGGGAGGLLTGTSAVTASSTYTVTVGAGGTYDNNGSNSVFSSITSTGGGAGGGSNNDSGNAGGSGGGGAGNNFLSINTVQSNWGTGIIGQGNRGGGGNRTGLDLGDSGGGGGGAGAIGGGSTGSLGSNNGGNGLSYTIEGGSAKFYAGGGGGRGGAGGLGGGGGVVGSSNSGQPGTNGLGGGGQGGGNGGSLGNGAGGSGIVVLRFPV